MCQVSLSDLTFTILYKRQTIIAHTTARMSYHERIASFVIVAKQRWTRGKRGRGMGVVLFVAVSTLTMSERLVLRTILGLFCV